MSGMIFDYVPGRIDARFNHCERFGDAIRLRVRIHGALVSVTPTDDQYRRGDPVDLMQPRASFSVYMTSVYCPFQDLIRFLEAVSVQVKECAFEWDAEGPDGRMEWSRRFPNEDGFLRISWCGCYKDHKREFSYRMMLNTRQMVGMMYTAFRRFVESPEYDPTRYEELKVKDTFPLVVNDASLDDFAQVLAGLDACGAESLLGSVDRATWDRHLDGNRRCHPLGHLFGTGENLSAQGGRKSLDAPEWNSWDRETRIAYAEDSIFSTQYFVGFGKNLREMRSPLLEAWLATP